LFRHAAITHPTYPRAPAAGQITKLEAMKQLLENWNTGLQTLAARERTRRRDLLRLYGSKLEDADLAPIPELTFPSAAAVDAVARRARRARRRPAATRRRRRHRRS
jgi:hypothetical protein